MSPIYYKCDCGTGTLPEIPCFWYYLINTNIGSDGNYYNFGSGYSITSDIFGSQFCSEFSNPPNGGIYDYANAIGINGISTIWLNTIPPSIGGILSYYGLQSQQNNYNFIFTNSFGFPVVSGWSQGQSCSLRCFEHPFQKPDLTAAIVQLDSANNISSMYQPTGVNLNTLDLSNPADITNFEILIRNIFGQQAVVTAQYPPSGNVILRINYVYTDQITFFMALGSQHTMTEVTCP